MSPWQENPSLHLFTLLRALAHVSTDTCSDEVPVFRFYCFVITLFFLSVMKRYALTDFSP
ncbi:hypothetical protein BJ508DRAFT_410059 [Ascobolus immersus RN42]|uniref:Uncharacterized protein n=1 Tax=Ascobolus immersus RN42 TaxID=1160509 RepID=A0A3N4IPS0_ASCIM|nr:hypothetical protein BJ508DRAFT_410059 [Ascobolus immersus RN42]